MSFFQSVYSVVKKIPRGKVATYGGIAKALGSKDARRVGHALHANPYEDRVPCHRVVNKDGRLAPNFARLQRSERSDGGQAFDGPEEQRRRLMEERVPFVDDNHVDLEGCRWIP